MSQSQSDCKVEELPDLTGRQKMQNLDARF